MLIDNISRLSLDELRQLFFTNVTLELSPSACAAIEASANFIKHIIATNTVIYGVNTGFGKLAKVSIAADKLQQLQINLILSHAVGTGPLLKTNTVKFILALKINSLACGFSGIQLETVNYLLKFFNCHYYPCVPSKGSVGASGDLAPLAHLSLPLIGEGQMQVEETCISGVDALQQLGLIPLQLAPKEGLALLNGTQVSTAIALANYFYLERIFAAAIFSGTLSTIASRSSADPFNALISQIRGQRAQQLTAQFYRTLLHDCEYEVATSRVQSPYSIRCQPQVMGACLQQMQHAANVLHAEANGVSDNPLIFVAENKILSGGNFHAEPVAFAADNLALCFAEIANIAERRIAMLIDNTISDLPPFLVNEPGLNSGFMMAHVTASALVSENKVLSHPASVDSIPTSANQEDHVSMATYAAQRLTEMVENSATVIAIELLAACQGIDFIDVKLNAPLQQCYDLTRQHSKFYHQDRSLAEDITIIKNLILNGEYAKIVDFIK